MKWPRFTLRALMAAVVLSALVAWGYTTLRSRSAVFAVMASEQRSALDVAKANAERKYYLSVSGSRDKRLPRIRQPNPPTPDPEDARVAFWKRAVAYEQLMYQKYSRAARYPWLPLASDSAPPQEP